MVKFMWIHEKLEVFIVNLGYPKFSGLFLNGKSDYQWMMTGGTSIYGDLHMGSWIEEICRVAGWFGTGRFFRRLGILLGGSPHLVSGLVHPSYKRTLPPLIPFITRVITHLLRGMNHQVWNNHPNWRTHILQRGWNKTTNQIQSRWGYSQLGWFTTCSHIKNIFKNHVAVPINGVPQNDVVFIVEHASNIH